MNVSIKQFNVQMDVKTKGIEFEVRTPKGEHLGDLVLTKTRLEWHTGKAQSGPQVDWKDFIGWMEQADAESKK